MKFLLPVCFTTLSLLAADPLAQRPPMGWNGYNAFRDEIDDALIRRQADALVSSGMKEAGLRGNISIRDPWTHKDLGVMHDSYETSVPRHGSVLFVLKLAR